MANQENIEQILNIFEQKPWMHNQSSWSSDCVLASTPVMEDNFCGTTLCIAGLAAHLDGWDIVRSGGSIWRAERYHAIDSRWEITEYFDTIGRNFLEITEEEANALFYSSDRNSMEMLRELREYGYLSNCATDSDYSYSADYNY